ncbi:MAG: glycoside hydrolase family 9 protein [Prevotellaceae bacterium]|jgi:hypothetical protein|nr:glycoside hydrolase family 9 protein [Prevotellaceae bacterium]
MDKNFLVKKKNMLIVLFSIYCFGVQGQAISRFILTDQFGYRPNTEKTAVIKDPVIGFDSNESFTPGATYRVVNASTEEAVYEGTPSLFNHGTTDEASGDKIWWFDFSSVTEPGEYYVLDAENNVKSHSFLISEDIYNDLLKYAVRTFFYQRAGHEKPAQYAGVDWTDGASHVGRLQDKNCRFYNRRNDASTELDLHGGWYDAGDYNKYTSWTCNYIVTMMQAYLENPDIWRDDYNIPESGNGIPDLLDEAKWGLDWVLRMQQQDGSVLCVMELGHASPPSAATGQSLYGPATASASWSAAKAFAISYKVYKEIEGMSEYAEQLKTAAIKAWNWAEQNPDVMFFNKDILAAGEQEIEKPDPSNAYAYDGRSALRIAAALYLYEMTGESSYHTVFTNNYQKLQIFLWGNDAQHYWASDYFMLFDYLGLDSGDPAVKNNITTAFKIAFNKSGNYAGMLGKDGYRSFVKAYDWGSNGHKSNYGSILYLLKSLEPEKDELYLAAAEDYLHYIHGANPFGMVFLSNMNKLGASNSVTEFYHSWFTHGSSKWDKVTAFTPGPAPGFLTGGPSIEYLWDGCCPNGCGSNQNNAVCTSEEIPVGQPHAKMYKDFNTSWPLNSWIITENSNGYQLAYIRLLSKFVTMESGNPNNNQVKSPVKQSVDIYPNPAKEVINVRTSGEPVSKLELYDMQMRLLSKQQANASQTQLNISSLPQGIYFIRVETTQKVYMERFVKQ